MAKTTTAAATQTLGFNDLARAFSRRMADLMDRWADEREYERGEFLAHFAAIGKKIGVRVHGLDNRATMALRATVPTAAGPGEFIISMTPGGLFRVKAIR
jgi:hypothetical protein